MRKRFAPIRIHSKRYVIDWALKYRNQGENIVNTIVERLYNICNNCEKWKIKFTRKIFVDAVAGVREITLYTLNEVYLSARAVLISNNHIITY